MYRTNDGQMLMSLIPADIIKELHNISWTPSTDDRAFMRDTASRIKLQFDKQIRVGSPEDFITDLLEIGLLFEEEIPSKKWMNCPVH